MCVGLFRNSGKAYIRKILQNFRSVEFLSAVIAEVIEPFGIEDATASPCLSSALSITADQAFFKLTLLPPSKCDDIPELLQLIKTRNSLLRRLFMLI